MVLEFKVGDAVRLKYKHKYEFTYLYGSKLIVEHIDGEELYLKTLDKEIAFRGHGHNHVFERIGNNINNEAFELILNNELKSFQAILDDGRIVNVSCLT